MLKEETPIELHCPLIGMTAPSQHSYELFSSICRIVPLVHECGWLGIHGLRGTRTKPGIIVLSPGEKLRLRLPLEHIPDVYPVAGRVLDIDGHKLRCGIPQVRTLSPSSALHARCVIIKIKDESNPSPDVFRAAVERKLEQMSISAAVQLDTERGNKLEPVRRILRVKDIKLVGYGVTLTGLSDDDSLKVQTLGIGGRRKMGAGLFVPLARVCQ